MTTITIQGRSAMSVFGMVEWSKPSCDAAARALRARPSAWRRLARGASFAAALALFGAAAVDPASAAASKEYGKPGEAIDLVVGYQPYYTESWSGIIMRDKKFYEKYLPKGIERSNSRSACRGAIIVNGMLAGKVDIGYVGDMPGIVSTSHADVPRHPHRLGRWLRFRSVQQLPRAHRRAAIQAAPRTPSNGSAARPSRCPRAAARTASPRPSSNASRSSPPST